MTLEDEDEEQVVQESMTENTTIERVNARKRVKEGEKKRKKKAEKALLFYPFCHFLCIPM